MAKENNSRIIRFTHKKSSVDFSRKWLWLAVTWRAFTWSCRRLKPIAYHPIAIAGITVTTVSYLISPWLTAALFWGVLVWQRGWPYSYNRHAQHRVDSFIAGFNYRHRPRRKLSANGLLNDQDPIPTISHVTKTGCITDVKIKMSHGDDINYWRERSTRLAQTYGALSCKIDPHRREVLHPLKHEMVTKPRWAVLSFLTRDPFSTGLGIEYINRYAHTTPQPVVAVHRDGTPVEDNLETHTLAIAMTRRGKSNRIRARIYANRHKIQSGELELWLIDGKSGVEGSFLEHLVARHAYGDTEANPDAYNPAEFDKLLKDAALVMKRRQRRMRGQSTKHTATPKEPWLLIIIDELLVLTSKAVPPELRNSIAASIRVIQQQGIACGVTLDAATQLAQKELIDFRDGFTKFELGKVERGVVDMIFGSGWWERGARADEIPDDLPGVFYVKTDATMVPTEIRYPLVTDADLKPLKPARDSVLWRPWTASHLKPVDNPPDIDVEPDDEDLESVMVSDNPFGGVA